MQGGVEDAFDPGVFDVVERNTAVALFESLRVAFEDVEEFLDDGLVDGVFISHHISVNGDAVVFRWSRQPVRCHQICQSFPRCVPQVKCGADEVKYKSGGEILGSENARCFFALK